MKISSTQAIKLANMRLVMEKIIELRYFTRVELSRITSLNKATVSSIVNEFLENKLIVESDDLVRTSGRSAKVFSLNENAGRIISLELLPNKIFGVVTNLFGEIVYQNVEPIYDLSLNSYINKLLRFIDLLRNNTHESIYGLIGIGVAVYGIVSKDQIVKFAPINNWQDVDFKTIIEEYTNIETFIQNESNVSVMSNLITQNKEDNIVSMHIGAGVGMGIIIDRKIYTGNDGYAGEIGHTIVELNGRECICGNKGCLETYISTPSILNQYYLKTNKHITLEDFISMYKNNERVARDIYQEFIDYTTVAINNISQTLNPHTITIDSQLVSQIPETISILNNNLKSKAMKLSVLERSKYTKTKIVEGITHTLIKKFLDVKNYNIKNI